MPYPKGKPKSEESKRKASEAQKGRKRDPELIKRIVETRIANGNNRVSEEARRKISETKKRQNEEKRRAGIPLKPSIPKGTSPVFSSWEAEPTTIRSGHLTDYRHSEESKRKMSEAKKRQWAEGVYANKAPARRRRVSKTERLLSPVAEALGYAHNDSAQAGYFYIPLGAGRGMTPDFVDREGRRVLEYFGNFWHHPDDEDYYVEAYAEAGWECRVVWESDLPKFIKEVELSAEDRGALNDHLCQLKLTEPKGNPNMVPKRTQVVKDKEAQDATDPEAS